MIPSFVKTTIIRSFIGLPHMTPASFVKTTESYEVCRWIIRGLPIGRYIYRNTESCVAAIAGLPFHHTFSYLGCKKAWSHDKSYFFQRILLKFIQDANKIDLGQIEIEPNRTSNFRVMGPGNFHCVSPLARAYSFLGILSIMVHY